MTETERIIANTNATMTMEDMPLTSADMQRISDCLVGKKSFNTAVNELIAQYRKT
ncbi:MAG TPA: hypothetical protein IAA30_00230 [Candidatus Treponema faecavium]|nr:hypothetical protein [Candidatus Treponema faecavium]